MVERRQYRRPPIIEAVVEFTFDVEVEGKDLSKAGKKIGANYKTNDSETQITTSFDVQAGTTTFEQRQAGQRMTSADQTEILIVRPGSLVVSQKAPYVGWDKFILRAQRDFGILKKTAGSRAVRQLGVRYINRLDIPIIGETPFEVKTYLNSFPEYSLDGEQIIREYTMQVVSSLAREICMLRVTTGTMESPVPGSRSLLLDIDIVRSEDVPRRDDDLWELLSSIRLQKNDVFERLITDATRGLFE